MFMTYFHVKLHITKSNSELLLLRMLFNIPKKKKKKKTIALFHDFKLDSYDINPP